MRGTRVQTHKPETWRAPGSVPNGDAFLLRGVYELDYTSLERYVASLDVDAFHTISAPIVHDGPSLFRPRNFRPARWQLPIAFEIE